MLRNVPTGTSDFRGTIAVSTIPPCLLTNLTWLPLWLASANPAASSLRLISRKGRGLSRPNLNLDGAHFGRPCSVRRFKMKFQRFFQIRERLVFCFALAGNVNFQALGHIPVPFAPHRCCKRSLHERIVSQDGTASHAHPVRRNHKRAGCLREGRIDDSHALPRPVHSAFGPGVTILPP
jgi:hypothetical protein